MRNIVIALTAIAVIAGGFIFFNKPKQEIPTQSATQPESTTSAQTIPGYQGRLLAGSTAPFLEFKKGDYDKALAENKIILLNFYANWCPICRGEEPTLHQGFNSLTTDQVIGFRVNFNDSDTDEDEKVLAKQLKIPYQHTKVVLKNGKEFSRSLDAWDKATFDKEISKALAN